VRQFASWQRAGLVPAGDSYSFSDVVQIRKVSELCARKVSAAVIRRSLDAMQKVAGLENPLLETGAYAAGHRVAFRHDGRVLEPLAGQFVFDFGPGQMVVANTRKQSAAPTPEFLRNNIAEFFSRGIALEENPSTQMEAISMYERVLSLDPEHAAAHINLGTIFYNRQEYGLAEHHYRCAVAADPRYALAYFDLGNVLDETGRVQEAIRAYQSALQLAPTYADAHYNLALSYEKAKEPRKALKHWRAYLKLDSTGPWAVHARNQVHRLLQSDRLKAVPPNGRA
jgi:tetratricopeptide (TPR) repeat protein